MPPSRSIRPRPSSRPFAVVIPTHDTRELTLACLASLAATAGSSQELEVLVVDDGSRDGTSEAVAAAWPRVRLLRHATARGFTASANAGLDAAAGDPLLLLNSDTEVDPDALERLAAAFRERPALGIAGAALRYPDGRPQWSHGPVPGPLWFFAAGSGAARWLAGRRAWQRLRRLLARAKPSQAPAARPDQEPVQATGWVTGAALAVRRAVLDQVGPLDEGFRFYAQDLDLCTRARAAGWEVAVVPGARVIHHHGSTIAAVEPESSIERQHLALLWTDLLRWAARHRGVRWARRARRALVAGVALRLAARRLAAARLSGAARRRWERDSAVLRLALSAVRQAAVGSGEISTGEPAG